MENGLIAIAHGSEQETVFAGVYFWLWDKNCFTGDNYVVTSSNNSQLLRRAQNDITTAFNVDPAVVAPTQLIMVELDNAKIDATSAQVIFLFIFIFI